MNWPPYMELIRSDERVLQLLQEAGMLETMHRQPEQHTALLTFTHGDSHWMVVHFREAFFPPGDSGYIAHRIPRATASAAEAEKYFDHLIESLADGRPVTTIRP